MRRKSGFEGLKDATESERVPGVGYSCQGRQQSWYLMSELWKSGVFDGRNRRKAVKCLWFQKITLTAVKRLNYRKQSE